MKHANHWYLTPFYLLGISLLLQHPPAWSGITVTDDSGYSITLEKPARRIVSLAPHITELLFAAGAGEVVAGTSEFSDFPQAALSIPRISGGGGLDLEAIVALQPDLVIAWQSGNPAVQINRLRALGLPVYLSEPRALEDIAHSIEDFGALAGTGAEASRQAQAFRQRLALLQHRYAQRAAVGVFYQVWQRPLMTVNGTHLISDVIRLCSGRNVFADLPLLAPQVTTEAVLAANPDVIVVAAGDESSPDWLDEWRRWPELAAVRHEHLYAIPRDLLVRHTPRILDGAEQLCRLLERVRAVKR